MNFKLLSILLLTSTGLWAAGGETDTLPRVVNFLIFAWLAYFFFADMIKKFFGARREEIASSFEKVQDRIKEAKANREAAQRELEEARSKAEEIVAYAKNEAQMLADRIASRGEEECALLGRQQEESLLVAHNKMVRTVVSDTMAEILQGDDILADQDQVVENLIKRVA